jgi:chromosome segregation ATPase
VAKLPEARWQRMQKIIMELKLLTVAARRADAAPSARGVSDTALRSEIQQLEGRLSARLAAHEKNIAASQQAAGEAVESLRGQLAAAAAQFAAIQERPVHAELDIEALTEQIQSRVEKTIAAVIQHLQAQVQDTVAAANQQHTTQVQETFGSVTQELAAHVKETVDAANREHAAQLQETIAAAKQQQAAQTQEALASVTQEVAARVKETVDTANREHAAQVQEAIARAQEQTVSSSEAVTAVNQRIAAAEQNMEEIRKHFATLQENVAGDLHDFETSLKSQGVAIESARTAMAQTDDLVERVVEALELLQSSLLDQHETAGVN